MTPKRKIDPNEALVMLQKHQPSFDRMKVEEVSQNLRWQDEIAMLERRVHDVYEMVYLDDVDQIAVRTALSEEEMQTLQVLEKRTTELHKEIKSITNGEIQVEDKDQGLSERHEELSNITYQQIALMTANPLITADWLADNKAKWPVSDALVIMSAFMESSIRRRVGRVKEIQSFLTE